MHPSLHILRWLYNSKYLFLNFFPAVVAISPELFNLQKFQTLLAWVYKAQESVVPAPSATQYPDRMFSNSLICFYLLCSHSLWVFHKSLVFAEFGSLAASPTLPSFPDCQCSGCSSPHIWTLAQTSSFKLLLLSAHAAASLSHRLAGCFKFLSSTKLWR